MRITWQIIVYSPPLQKPPTFHLQHQVALCEWCIQLKDKWFFCCSLLYLHKFSMGIFGNNIKHEWVHLKGESKGNLVFSLVFAITNYWLISSPQEPYKCQTSNKLSWIQSTYKEKGRIIELHSVGKQFRNLSSLFFIYIVKCHETNLLPHLGHCTYLILWLISILFWGSLIPIFL